MPVQPLNIEEARNSALFKYLRNNHEDELHWGVPTPEEAENLSQGDLNEISRRGAELAKDFALRHEAQCNPEGKPVRSAAGAEVIDDYEKSVVLTLINHPRHGQYIEIDAVTELKRAFELPDADIHPPQHLNRPQKEANPVELPARVSGYSGDRLANASPDQLADAMAAEYRNNRRAIDADPTGGMAVGLLRDYCAALYSHGDNLPNGRQIAEQFVGVLDTTRYGKALGAKCFNGAPWSLAQSLALGMDPNTFHSKFPKANRSSSATYLSMNGGMAKAMSHADEYRAALGQEKKAEAFEKKSPVGWLIGEEAGHSKRGNLNEKRPYSSSGLNWGTAIFPAEAAALRDLPLTEGKEFAIDCLDSFSNFIVCDRRRGDRIGFVDENNNQLVATPVYLAADGSTLTSAAGAASYHVKFAAQGGAEVTTDKVLGLIFDRAGNVKGDRRAANEVNMWWWGFCDRNTAQGLYKGKYEIPQLTRDTIKVKAADQTIVFPKDVAQQLIDCDIPDIVTGETMCGFRFDDESQQVVMKSGEVKEGRVAAEVFENTLGGSIINEDQLAIHDSPGRPLLGALVLEGQEPISVRHIVSIEKDAADTSATPQVKIKIKQGEYERVADGRLETPVRWETGATADGKTVVTQDDTFPVRGAIPFDLASGEKIFIPASDISQIVGETQKDMRISQYVAFIEKNQGVYGTDGAVEVVVSNGVRWVNEFEFDVRTGDDRPEWMQGAIEGIEGPLERKSGDSMCYVRGLAARAVGGEPTSETFAGWMQLDANRRVVNEGFTDGRPDFAWGATGKLNWLATSSFNPYMPPELRVALLVNGVTERGDDLDKLAQRLNLPENYREYLVPQD